MSWVAVAVISAAVIGAGTAVYAGEQQGKIARYNANLNERMAEQKRLDAEYAATRKREQNEASLSRQRLAYNKAGVYGGTVTDVLVQTQRDMELDALAVLAGAESESASYMAQAQINRMQGRTAQTTGYLNAGSSLLSGATQLSKSYRSGAGTSGASIG